MKNQRIPRRRGFTLTELLVVIAILAVLAGLMIPAAQRARGAAHRLQCSSNLRQVGIALNNYASTTGAFPMGVVDGGKEAPLGIDNDNIGHGWVSFILPELDNSQMGNTYRYDRDFRDSGNQPNNHVPIKVLTCPAAPPNRVVEWGPGRVGACMDYASIRNVDPDLVSMGLVDKMADNRGLLARNKFTRYHEVLDGLSNTIAVAECAGRNDVWRAGKPIDDRVAGGPWSSQFNRLIIQGSTSDGSQRLAPTGKCAVNCTNEHEVYSFHTGGANVLMGDGAVRFLSQTIDIREFAAMATRAGKEKAVTGN